MYLKVKSYICNFYVLKVRIVIEHIPDIFKLAGYLTDLLPVIVASHTMNRDIVLGRDQIRSFGSTQEMGSSQVPVRSTPSTICLDPEFLLEDPVDFSISC